MTKAKKVNTMQINYWTLGGFDGAKPPIQALTEARKMGFDGVELCFGAGEFAPGISEGRCKEIRRAAREMGMKIETLATGQHWQTPLSSPRASVRDKAVAFTRQYLQVARWLGAKTVLVIPGAVAVPWDSSQPVVPYAKAWKLATQSIRRLVPTAAKLRVTMALENVWNWFLADPVAMRTFVDQFKSPRVGVYFDVGNCQINGFAEHWVEILGRRIKAVHLKNFTRQDCGGVLHGFGDDLAKGDVNYPATLKALKAVGYAGPFTAEMVPFSRLPNLVLPDMKLARATARKMSKILART